MRGTQLYISRTMLVATVMGFAGYRFQKQLIFECCFISCECFLFLFLALVSEVYLSPDAVLEHSVPSSCLVPSDSFILSSDNMAAAIQTANNVVNPAVLEERVKPQFLFH